MRVNNKIEAKPFVKWVGGKRQLIPSIKEYLPKELDKLEDLTYVEPFVGAGAVFYFMLQNYKNIKQVVLNDINTNLIKTYRVIRDNADELVKELSYLEKAFFSCSNEEAKKDFYLERRKDYNNLSDGDLDIAKLFLFLNRTCFNGLYRVNSKGLFNVPFGRYKNPNICNAELIYRDSELLQDIIILNGDFQETKSYITNNTFVYFDPPYRPLNETSSFTSYTKGGFDDNEQIRLKNFYDYLDQENCLLMLSNADCQSVNPKDRFFDDLYENYSINRVQAKRSVNVKADKRGLLSELLITNY